MYLFFFEFFYFLSCNLSAITNYPSFQKNYITQSFSTKTISIHQRINFFVKKNYQFFLSTESTLAEQKVEFCIASFECIYYIYIPFVLVSVHKITAFIYFCSFTHSPSEYIPSHYHLLNEFLCYKRCENIFTYAYIDMIVESLETLTFKPTIMNFDAGESNSFSKYAFYFYIFSNVNEQAAMESFSSNF